MFHLVDREGNVAQLVLVKQEKVLDHQHVVDGGFIFIIGTDGRDCCALGPHEFVVLALVGAEGECQVVLVLILILMLVLDEYGVGSHHGHCPHRQVVSEFGRINASLGKLDPRVL